MAYNHPAPRRAQRSNPYDLPIALVTLVLLAALGYVAYLRYYAPLAAPDYGPDVPRQAAPALLPTPFVIIQRVPIEAPAAPAPAVAPVADPAPPAPVPAAPTPIVIIQRVDGTGGQFITGSGACAVARGARRCGK